MIYLDSAATMARTNMDDLIIDEIVKAMKESWYNPSSLYESSVEVKYKIEEARKVIADYINAEPEEIYFTSGASESNNWMIQGFLNRYNQHKTVFLTSTIEHKSITECAKAHLFKSEFIPVNNEGVFNIDLMKSILELYPSDFKKLVSVQLVNNELGVIQNIKEIADTVHEYSGIMHSDATQALGKMKIDVKKLGVDALSLSGHKLSPVLRGIGILYLRKGIEIKPLIYGSQEKNLRGGTENTYLILGLARAIELQKEKERIISLNNISLLDKRNYFLYNLKQVCKFKVNELFEQTVPNIISITFDHNVTAESLLYMLDLEGVCVSTGSACNSQSIEGSRVLRAIGLSKEDILRTIRISLNDEINYETIDIIVDKIGKAIKLTEMTEEGSLDVL